MVIRKREICGLMAFLACIALGCASSPVKPEGWETEQPTFRDYYQLLDEYEAQEHDEAQSDEPRVTMSASGMPCGEFIRWLSNETGVSIVIDRSLDSEPISVDVVDQTVSEVLGVVARRVGSEVNRSGNLYFIGRLKKEDRGLFVRRVRRLQSSEITEAVGTMLSEFGEVVTFQDGLLVVSDRVEVLQRVSSLCDQIESADSATWAIQLYIVTMTYEEMHDLGLDVEPALDVALKFAVASSVGATSDVSLKGGLDAILRAAHGRESLRIMAEPLFLLTDGESGNFRRGEAVPIPEKTVSPEGTVTVSGYDVIETGLTCKVDLREVSDRTFRLTTDIEISDIRGYVESAPRLGVEQFSTVAVLESGGVYLLGSVERESESSGILSGWNFGTRNNNESTLWQVWARAHRVR